MKHSIISLDKPLLRTPLMSDSHAFVPSVLRRIPSGDFPFGKRCGDGPHTGRQTRAGATTRAGVTAASSGAAVAFMADAEGIHLRVILRKLEQLFEDNRIMASTASFPIAESQIDLRQPQYQKNREEWGPILEKLNQALAESSGEGDSKSVSRHLSRGQLLGM